VSSGEKRSTVNDIDHPNLARDVAAELV
jgi:hypothetical protein